MKTITKKLDEVEFLSFLRHDEEKKEYLFRKINFESLMKWNVLNAPYPFVVCKSGKMTKEKELIMCKILENRGLLVRISGKTCFIQDLGKFGELVKHQGKDSSFGTLPRDLLIATEFLKVMA